MTEPMPTPIREFQCPQCDAGVQSDWACCPKCGTWLKPDGPFSYRVLGWLGVLVVLVSATALLARNSTETAVTFALIFGLPMCYVFGKAVWFRATGKPLTYQDLGMSTLRAFFVNVGLLIVLPLVLGIAAFLLLFAICMGAMATGQF